MLTVLRNSNFHSFFQCSNNLLYPAQVARNSRENSWCTNIAASRRKVIKSFQSIK
jgi:hypothetical protein